MQNLKLSLPFLFIFIVIQLHSQAQLNDVFVAQGKFYDSLKPNISWQKSNSEIKFNARSYILPCLMIAYGFTAIGSDGLKHVNAEVKYEVYTEHTPQEIKIDNYLQYAPAFLAFGLDVAGIKAKHDLKDRTMLVLMSNVITSVSVSSIKKHSHQLRPDGSSYTSFPSAHTAFAFTNAEFLRREYKDHSPWYGIAGYSMAIATGYLRMYNNKHWVSDVIAGAGVGILSAKLTYWLYPTIKHSLFKNKLPNTAVMPTYQDGAVGLGLVHHF